MNSIFEVTGEDIAQLGDHELRQLIGRLCEADFRAEGLPIHGIRFGGHQDASDGAIDVLVDVDFAIPAKSFLKKPYTVIQVKKPKMPPAEIITEMTQDGQLKQSIRTAIKAGGGYAIVSSGENLTEPMFEKRIAKMKSLVVNEPNKENFTVDFLDRSRVAQWVRNYPAMIIWVHAQLNRSFLGWRPYENWANPKSDTEEEYLIDEKTKFFDHREKEGEKLDIVSGINRLRQSLASPGVNRLIGLSGVGKTRLVQALFDDRVGDHALNPTEVIYADIGDAPDPGASAMVDLLNAEKFTGVIIIDNCKPDTHHVLTRRCAKNPNARLLTIEYDVTEPGTPEETAVFELDSSNSELIERLIRFRYPEIKYNDATHIAENSEGNSRVALALAYALKSEKSISKLNQTELFRRLFYQRGHEDRELLVVGRACSLVYSFQGEDYQTKGSEIRILSSFFGVSPIRFVEHVRQLEKRKLIQSRSEWRALLPHAIANNLAEGAFQDYGWSTMVNHFQSSGSERLLKSFTNRLHFLPDSDNVKSIVRSWFSEKGRFADLLKLDDESETAFFKVAYICPELTLDAIERISQNDLEQLFWGETSHFPNDDWANLFAYIAYRQNLFKRSVSLYIQFVLISKKIEGTFRKKEGLEQLFQIVDSGTQATPVLRAEVIEKLILDHDNDTKEIGFILLQRALQNEYLFRNPPYRDIGRERRGNGWRPSSSEEARSWFILFSELCLRNIENARIGNRIRGVFANSLRTLWRYGGLEEHISAWALKIHSTEAWISGWYALKETLLYDKDVLGEESIAKVNDLEENMRPKNLVEKIQAYVLHPTYEVQGLWDTESFEKTPLRERVRSAEDHAVELGRRGASDLPTLSLLSKQLFLSTETFLYEFGVGLGLASHSISEDWKFLYSKFSVANEKPERPKVLAGFLFGIVDRDSNQYSQIMDRLVNDPLLAGCFPYLQTRVQLGEKELSRLYLNLEVDGLDVRRFAVISGEGIHHSLSNHQLTRLLEAINRKSMGHLVSMEIMHMRSYSKMRMNAPLRKVGREALLMFSFDGDRHPLLDDSIAESIVKSCFAIGRNKKEAKSILEKILSRKMAGIRSPRYYGETLRAIASQYPIEFLDQTLGRTDYHQNKWRITHNLPNEGQGVFQKIGYETMLKWANGDVERIIRIIQSSQPFENNESGSFIWKEEVKRLFDTEVLDDEILTALAESVNPSTGIVYNSHILSDRTNLFEQLIHHPSLIVKSWAEKELRNLREEVLYRKEREKTYLDREKRRSQTFE